jgi:hypothetical protein
VEPADFGARGQCYLLHVSTSEDTPSTFGAPPGQVRYAAHYRDELVKQDGRRRFRRRTVNTL